MGIVIRISRVPLDSAREAVIREVFGDGVVIHTDDFALGENPCATVERFINDVEAHKRDRVLGVELDTSQTNVKKVMAGTTKSVVFFRALYELDENRKPVVETTTETGRPTYKFAAYQRFVRLDLVTAPLDKPGC